MPPSDKNFTAEMTQGGVPSERRPGLKFYADY
jgi:hypothetical protein